MNPISSQQTSVAGRLSQWLGDLSYGALPPAAKQQVTSVLLDVAGLCVAARNTDYVRSVLTASVDAGSVTAIGHGGAFDAASACLINGIAIHGEDFDDTFEEGIVHSGAVVVPAVLAACERFGRSGSDAALGIAAGLEVMCRLSLVAPTAIHRAGFHPTAILGPFGAAAGAGLALGLTGPQLAAAFGITGSMAGGLIEYLADGSWTKRMHAGWAAQSGLRAALLAKHEFTGPRTVFEGRHGLFAGFAPDVSPDFKRLIDDLGTRWEIESIAFKPYACGTICQPFIDCAIELAQQGIRADDIADILCEVGEGSVHRLWEPLSEKHRPATPYAAKFSVPYCLAVGFIDGDAGLLQFTPARISDPEVISLTGKVRYVIDPDNEYPRNFTGHLRATLKDGSTHEIRRPHLRGGTQAPLSRADLVAKFKANTAFGGWDQELSDQLRSFCENIDGQSDMRGLVQFRR